MGSFKRGKVDVWDLGTAAIISGKKAVSPCEGETLSVQCLGFVLDVQFCRFGFLSLDHEKFLWRMLTACCIETIRNKNLVLQGKPKCVVNVFRK